MVNHFKKYGAIYLILLTTLVVFLLIRFNNTEEEMDYTFDTSYYTVINVEEANKLFESQEPSFLFIGRQGCSACYNFNNSLIISSLKYQYTVYYLDTNTVDNNEELNKLIAKLDLEYTYNSVTDQFGNFYGATPMLAIIKNGKQVWGYLGSMNEVSISKVVKEFYDINEEN